MSVSVGWFVASAVDEAISVSDLFCVVVTVVSSCCSVGLGSVAAVTVYDSDWTGVTVDCSTAS